MKRIKIFKRDVFGHIILIKRFLIFFIGILTFPRFNWLNKIKVEGTGNLEGLEDRNVLFVSNHQTYFADVLAISHVFCSVRWGFKNKVSNPIYLLSPRVNTYFIAAEETMKAGWLPKIFAYAGSVSIKRTWREAGKDINRKVEMGDIRNIGDALNDGWVITFPQGTTTPFVPGRRGTTHIIKKFKPVVIPVVINGFRRAFDKKGLKLKKTGTTLSIKFKKPMQIDYEGDADIILSQVMRAIEQSEKFSLIKTSSR